MNTNDPLPPPFDPGVQVIYRGTRMLYRDPEAREPLLLSGVAGVVEYVRLGRKGTGEVLEMDDDDPVYHVTMDGCSCILMSTGHRTIVRESDREDWEVTGRLS